MIGANSYNRHRDDRVLRRAEPRGGSNTGRNG